MAGTTKLMTAGGGGVILSPASSIASDVTVNVPVTGVSGGTLVCSDSSGSVGIGTNSIDNIGNSGNKVLEIYGGANAPWMHFTNSTTGQASGDGLLVGVSGSDAYLIQRESANMIFRTADTERMRIDSSGRLLVGTTNSYGGCKQTVYYDGSAQRGIVVQDSSSSTCNPMGFVSGTTLVGWITTTTTATTYNTASDYRLKENIQPMTGALEKVAQLNPVTYKWKADGSDGQGFIAHELQAVVPDCVTGEKDAVDADGNPDYQGIDTSFLVATLTKAIQEQQAQIEALAAKVAALEAK